MITLRLLAAPALAGLALTACSADPSPESASMVSAPAPSTSATSAPVPAARTDLIPDGLTVTMPQGWRDASTPTFRHVIAPDVASDPEGERWADVLIYEAASTVDPASGAVQPLPSDPIAWVRTHPSFEVLDERAVEVDGRPSTQFDVAWGPEGGHLFQTGDVAHESFADIHERFILVPIGQRWVVVQASTFRGAEGLSAPYGPDDTLSQILASIDLPEA